MARIGLILAGILISALLMWFFYGKVSLYEYSDELEFTPDGTLIAQFQPDIAASIRPGQEGKLILTNTYRENSTPVPVYVFRIDRESGKIELLVGDIGITSSMPEGKADGVVELVVAQITPLELVLRTGIGVNQLPSSGNIDQTQE